MNPMCIGPIMQLPLNLLKSSTFSGFNLPWSSLVKEYRNLPHISLKTNEEFLSFWLNRICAEESIVHLFLHLLSDYS
jgi:hypothetical protein